MKNESNYSIERDGKKIFLTWEEVEKAMTAYLDDTAKAIVKTFAPELPSSEQSEVAESGVKWFVKDIPQELSNRIEIPE